MGNTIIHGSKLAEILREDVHNALLRQDVEADELTEFYLVNLLQEFHNTEGHFISNGKGAVEKPLGLLLLEALNGSTSQRLRCLKRVGDSALIIVGFFEDSIHRSIMEPSYYISIGESAYSTLAHIHESGGAFFELYSELSQKFAKLVDAISAIAPWNIASSDTDLLRIYERWILTGDDTLRELLEQKGIQTDGEMAKN